MPAPFRPVTVTGWLACMQCFTFAKSLARIYNSMVPYAHHAGRPHSVEVMTEGHRRFRTTIPRPGVDTKDAGGVHGSSLDREHGHLYRCSRQTHPKHLGQMMHREPINRWFVTVRPVAGAWNARETKGFPTETEARRFARAMHSKAHYVTAGTITPHQPKRRTIADCEIAQWIEGEK
jgi:hypothetical protein